MEKYRLVEERKADRNASGTDTAAVSYSSCEGRPNDDGANIGSSQNTTEDPRDRDSSALTNEIRITQQGKPRNYITYAMGLFTDHGADRIVLKAMGRAVNKSVTIAEIIKRKTPLHQITSINSCELVDVFEPLEEGLDRVESRRYVSCMTILLSKSPLDQNHIGYQPPLPLEEMQKSKSVKAESASIKADSASLKGTAK
eukprot:CAMPEP_0194282876 /NCGR_PEP_ID=MMETSP0169-20130528/24132_1 /TAXON_ID=218684 /ORGANISM="Corethron pennatum, Strain L29A3" /LENGTH=198 /DNA_ID=CAMNT_0039028337 /DNA_START=245 /DNA_END=841 /DNA_ORIENTATION=+